ncbi:ALDH-like protein [Aspergillus brunneoviolaceus CBS 621.78]|uniref:ALDH-like protein n=1 Tax=Aspergillus brunneoviolaceus CBS 621.78 TaxID=1450534 RepID=A0ACD1GQ31_9EURO|nr:ALDH-like protein [Aspergillus brunneoviolaceus CBS 621.78]RAH51350.1 ALDH-like protein [Aspergillus brunneoviolaceus CBS 621.78]
MTWGRHSDCHRSSNPHRAMTDEAVQAAREAFPIWKARPLEDRQQCLHRIADELENRQDGLRPILFQGRPALQEILANIEIDDALRFSCLMTLFLSLSQSKIRKLGIQAAQSCPDKIEYEAGSVRTIAVALVMGNCVIVKPSPMTRYATLEFGLLQALNGGNEIGARMTTHPGIGKISFTDFTATGCRIAESAGRSLKRVTLELGATMPTSSALISKWTRGAFSMRRVYFRSAFIAAVQKIVVDRAAEHSPLFSPLQNRMHAKQAHTFSEPLPGLYISPTAVDRPPNNARIWSDEAELIRRVNATESRLGACCIARQLEVGTVWLNSFAIPHPHGYFSGWKQSGIEFYK